MSNSVKVTAEMAASVWKVEVTVGQQVAADEILVILESMKMEIPVHAPAAGVVTAVHVAPEQSVREGDLIVSLERSA
jgi:acetyl-CoA carboxylase biotin carboxyl carrier protein